MENSPGSEERWRITRADVQPAQGERLEGRSARTINPFEGRKCQAITRLDDKLDRSRGEGALPAERVRNCCNFTANRGFQELFRFRQLTALRDIIKTR